MRENKGRVPHTHEKGDEALLRKEGASRKLASPREGPHEITHVHDNGTTQMQKGVMSKQVNIRRVMPHNEQTASTVNNCHARENSM